MPLEITQNVFEAVLARPVSQESGEHRSFIHLWWSAPGQGDRLVQVYMDGVLVEVTQDAAQRELWLICGRQTAHRIELLAVPANDPDKIWHDFEEELQSWSPHINGGMRVGVIRDERLPFDARLAVNVDNMSVDEGAMWPSNKHRGGFGALFGLGEFGRDAVTGLGLGRGELGMGALGVDGTAWRWRRDDIAVGSHTLNVGVADRTGQVVAGPLIVSEIQIENIPLPANTFTIAPDYTLLWTV